MSQAPILPMFVDAMIADTTHLSAEEFGAYHLILYATWRNNGAPLEDRDDRLARVCRLTLARWKKIRPVLVPFFDVTSGFWRQKRLEKEWEHALEKSGKQRGRALSRWHGKSLENNDSDNAAAYAEEDAPHLPGECHQTHNQTQEDSSLRSESDSPISGHVDLEEAALEAAFAKFWEAYPSKVAKKRARELFARVVRRKEASVAELVAGAARYARACTGTEPRFIAHPTTWLEEGRWADAPATAGQSGKSDETIRWEARLRGFDPKRPGSWLTSQWGPSPTEPGCMAPPDVLAQFGYSKEVRA